MATGREMLARFKSVDLLQIAGQSVDKNIVKVREYNIEQLMKGLNNRGLPLSPKYSEDPYFKKPGAWQRYAAFKQRLFPETPYDTPNLIIIGTYHNSIGASRQGNAIIFNAGAQFAASVAAKYQNTELGLSPESKHAVYDDLLKPDMLRDVRQKTGCK